MRAALLTALSLCLLLSGCGRQVSIEKEAPPEKSEVMLYSSMQVKQIKAIKAGFEEKYPAITMNYQFSGTDSIITKLNTEVQFNDVHADIIWAGNPSSYVSLKENRLLSPYISPEAEHIDPRFKDDEDYYVGARMFSAVIAYNTDLVSPEEAPRTWKDLLDPKWKDRLIVADPHSSGSSAYIMSSLMQNPHYGPKFFEQLRANGCMLEYGTTATHKQVADGHYAICIGLDYVASNFADDGAPMAVCYPKKDGVTVYCPIGLVAHCPNEVNAKLLYDYILSPEGQALLVDNHLVSIRSDVEQPGPSISQRVDSSMHIDIADISLKEPQYLKDFDRIFFAER